MSLLRHVGDSLEYLMAGSAYLLYRGGGRRTMPKELAPLENVSPLSDRVVRVLAQNPGPFTLQGTNTYLVGTGERRVLIDTGEGGSPLYIDLLTKALGNAKLSCIVTTHWHHDHVGGIGDVLNALRPPNEQLTVYKLRRSGKDQEERDAAGWGNYEYVESGHKLTSETVCTRFGLIHTPGHTSDHMAVYLEEECALFSGDCILGTGTATFEDLRTYMKSLETLLELRPAKIYPGHGPTVTSPSEKIQEYVKHRLQREEEIVAVLKVQGTATAMAITSAIYKEIPLAVKLGALRNTKQVLDKLQADARIKEVVTGVYSLC